MLNEEYGQPQAGDHDFQLRFQGWPVPQSPAVMIGSQITGFSDGFML